MKKFKKEKNVTGEGWTSVRTFLPKKEKKKNRDLALVRTDDVAVSRAPTTGH